MSCSTRERAASKRAASVMSARYRCDVVVQRVLLCCGAAGAVMLQCCGAVGLQRCSAAGVAVAADVDAPVMCRAGGAKRRAGAAVHSAGSAHHDTPAFRAKKCMRERRTARKSVTQMLMLRRGLRGTCSKNLLLLQSLAMLDAGALTCSGMQWLSDAVADADGGAAARRSAMSFVECGAELWQQRKG